MPWNNWKNIELILITVSGWIAFSLGASFIYILNDLIDIENDRAHPTKSKRPFASGDICISHGFIMMALLFLTSIFIALFLPLDFLIILITYQTLCIAYSLWLKAILLLDAIVLSIFYILRVVSGAALIGVEVSFWLLAFSMFIFFSLALVKRYKELRIIVESDSIYKLQGRSYNVDDINIVLQLGVTSGCLSVLVFCLFINSPYVQTHYKSPQILYPLCPIFLYWIGRIWIKTNRNDMDDDPVIFTIKDRVSRYVILIGILLTILSL